MSSRNDDEIKGMIFVLGMIGAAIYALAIVAFFFALFVTFAATIHCLLAWNKPVGSGKFRVTPEEARSFVGRGVWGALLLPVFLAFIDAYFHLRINWDFLSYFAATGYMIGSLGVEILMEEEQKAETPMIIERQQIIPPQQHQRSLPPASKPPFQYASWDDEEARR